MRLYRPPPSDNRLIANVGANPDDWSSWEQLCTRLRANTLSRAQCEQLYDVVIAAVSPPIRLHQTQTAGPHNFIRQADLRFPIDTQRYTRLAEAVGAIPSIVISRRLPLEGKIPFELQFPRNLPLETALIDNVVQIHAITNVQADDRVPVPLSSPTPTNPYEKGEAADLLSSVNQFSVPGMIEIHLPPGSHRLTFEVVSALLPQLRRPADDQWLARTTT